MLGQPLPQGVTKAIAVLVTLYNIIILMKLDTQALSCWPDHYSFVTTPPLAAAQATRSLVEQDPSGGSLNAPGKKGDAGKTQAWLFMSGFSRALREVAKVTTLGANKYTRNGWASVPNGSERYMEAFGRHLFDLGEGKVFDDGPGGLGPDVYHKASLVWNLLASLELDLREQESKK